MKHMNSHQQKPSARLVSGTAADRRVIFLDQLPFTIGRSSDRSLCLRDPQVSRDHAFIDRDADGYFIRDLSSLHGTFVNGLRVQANSAHLRDADTIVLGNTAEPLTFEAGSSDSKTRSLRDLLSPPSSADNNMETLSLLLEAAQTLNSDGGLNEVLHTMLEYTIRLTHAERGFVFLGSNVEDLQIGRGLNDSGEDLLDHSTISRSIVRDAVESQLEFILGDVAEEAAKPGRESLIIHDIRSVVAIPLRGRHSERLLGLLYLDSRSSTHDFTSTDKGTLLVIARQAATLLENLRMLEAEREAVLMRKELEIAASIQRQIIPQTLPQFATVRLAARTVPCTGIGGDFYDVIAVEGGFVAIVADVSGKGVPAALLASMVQGMVHAQITSGASLIDTVSCVNKLVCSRASEKYVTLAVLRYTEFSSGPAQVELVNGGHVSPIVIRRNGTVEVIAEGDMPVGLLTIATFHSVHFSVEVGDQIVLLSDGVSEAEDPAGVPFSTTELVRCLIQPDAVTTLFSALDHFCQGAHAQDDQTILTIERAASLQVAS